MLLYKLSLVNRLHHFYEFAPVAKYWPEFAQAGKEKIPVRYLLSHQSGLAAIDEPIPVEALYDWDRMIKLLEKT